MQSLSSFACDTYNALLDVADADEKIKKIGRNEAVDKLLSIILRHGLEKSLGIRLLHKHNTIARDEIMVSDSHFDEEGFALVTRANRAESISGKVVANSWQLTEQGFIPSEFSHAHLVESEVGPDVCREAFSEMAQAIESLNAFNLLGPTLNYSSFVKSHGSGEGWIFLEKTNYNERANVVRYVKCEDVALLKTRETVWATKLYFSAAGNKRAFTTACECQCSILPDSGEHQGTHFHPNPGGG
jgi:hypothetical protein